MDSNHRYLILVGRYESYLSHSDPVVLALNPFFVLEYVSICIAQPTLTPPSAGMILLLIEALSCPALRLSSYHR
jgi:hypothetical protein